MGEFQKEKEFLKRDKSLLKEKMSANVSSKKYALDFSKIFRQVTDAFSCIDVMFSIISKKVNLEPVIK